MERLNQFATNLRFVKIEKMSFHVSSRHYIMRIFNESRNFEISWLIIDNFN